MAYRPTAAEIQAAMTKNGAWKKATLKSWGVPWPPPKGWKQRLLAQAPASALEDPPKPRRDGLAAFPAERASSCSWCPNQIEIGDMITARREHGWLHVECAAAVDAMR